MNNKKINVSDELRDIENFLRINIMYILKNKYGDDWEKHLGVSEERLKIWATRMEEEKKRLHGNVSENRKLFYSDFYDLKTIIIKNWDLFHHCFPNKTIIENQLTQLESFRNPNAHNRDLLEHQKHLLIGYIGEIKMGIMRYRGSIEKKGTYFPEFDSMNVNGKVIHNTWEHLEELYRFGDVIEISVYVTVPNTHRLLYKMEINGKKSTEWTEENKFRVVVDNCKLGRNHVIIYYKSDADYHENQNWDGLIEVTYLVVDE